MKDKEKEELRRRLRLDSNMDDMENNIKENADGEKMLKPKSRNDE